MLTISEVIGAFKGKFSVFKKHPPVKSAKGFGEFLASRASFIAQKSLYGYLKTRMGLAYPKMFDDEVFVQSINVAKWNHYAACLSDLAIFMAAKVYEGADAEDDAVELARFWHHRVVRDRFNVIDFTGNADQFIAEFDARLKTVDWQTAAVGEGAFSESPPSLIRWAPIEQTFKDYDEPLVLNSIRFSWQAIRRDFVKLLDRDALLADWANYRKAIADGAGLASDVDLNPSGNLNGVARP